MQELQDNSNPGNGELPQLRIVQGTEDFLNDVLIQNRATNQILAVVKNQQAPASPPEDIVLDNAIIAENSLTGTVIGNFTTIDPNQGDTHSYELLNASGRFQIVGNTLQVANGTLLDFESNSSPEITVRSTDSEGLFIDKNFTINLADVPEVPILDLGVGGEGSGLGNGFTSNSGAVAIVDAAALTLSDVDSSFLNGATVRIANLLDGANEVLAATAVGNIAINYNSANGELTLSGMDSIANYQRVLASVTYNNTAANPNQTPRSIEFKINDGTNDSPAATTTLEINIEPDSINFIGSATEPIPLSAISARNGGFAFRGEATPTVMLTRVALM